MAEGEKARLRKRMRELEDELGGLRRVVLGKTSPLPPLGTVLSAEVTAYGETGCFALTEFGTGWIHVSEVNRRIVVFSQNASGDGARQVTGAILPAVEPRSWPRHVTLVDGLKPESVLPVGTKVWAEVAEPLHTGQLRLSSANIDQATGKRLPAERPFPEPGTFVRGIVHMEMTDKDDGQPYGYLIALPGFVKPRCDVVQTTMGLLHRRKQAERQRDQLVIGETLWVKVMHVDAEADRISLGSRFISNNYADGSYFYHEKPTDADRDPRYANLLERLRRECEGWQRILKKVRSLPPDNIRFGDGAKRPRDYDYIKGGAPPEIEALWTTGTTMDRAERYYKELSLVYATYNAKLSEYEMKERQQRKPLGRLPQGGRITEPKAETSYGRASGSDDSDNGDDDDGHMGFGDSCGSDWDDELAMQGVRPWDDDAGAVLDVLRGSYD